MRCKKRPTKMPEAPPPLKVEQAAEDATCFRWIIPNKFQLADAAEHVGTSQLEVTGIVTPDISRTVPSSHWPPDAWWKSKRAWATP